MPRCLLCVLAAVLACLIGCSTREPTAPAAAPSPDPRLATWPGDPDDGPARLMAANAGVLDLVDGCVVLRNGSAPTTLVLPAAVSAFDGAAVTIRGRSYPLGTPVLMGGGSYASDMQSRMRSIWSVPKSCPATEWWATGDLEQGIQTQPRKGEYEPWGFAAVWDSSRKPTPADALTLKTSLIVIPTSGTALSDTNPRCVVLLDGDDYRALILPELGRDAGKVHEATIVTVTGTREDSGAPVPSECRGLPLFRAWTVRFDLP